jgi:hypothetical protein
LIDKFFRKLQFVNLKKKVDEYFKSFLDNINRSFNGIILNLTNASFNYVILCNAPPSHTLGLYQFLSIYINFLFFIHYWACNSYLHQVYIVLHLVFVSSLTIWWNTLLNCHAHLWIVMKGLIAMMISTLHNIQHHIKNFIKQNFKLKPWLYKAFHNKSKNFVRPMLVVLNVIIIKGVKDYMYP